MKVYALFSDRSGALWGIFATEEGAEQARRKLRFSYIEEWEVEP